MLGQLVGYLRCPLCRAPLAAAPGPLRCGRGHAFDVARQGYVNLSAGRPLPTGDSAAMVAARERFLSGGGYGFLTAALTAELGPVPREGLVLDAGAGTGHHLAAVLAALPGAVGLALDTSKPALRRAARAHPRAGAALADTWRRLPVADGCVALLLNVFAPRNGAEFRRVLRPDGALFTVTPEADHLAELVARLRLLTVAPDKADRLAGSLEPWFAPAGDRRLARTLALSRRQVADLVAMGPSARHVEPERLAAAVADLPQPLPVSAAVRITRWRPAPR